MRFPTRALIGSLVTLTVVSAGGDAQARIREETRTLTTYPFSEPNPVPILTRDPRLYPYHSFEGYARDGVPRDWKVVVLENEYIEVFVLPEVGGKVWGAVVKRTGHEFIYRNEVMKFRNIALRGPWTSGGIEFNFGIIGHAPSTATPVDYTLRQNPDGSVSCFVGAMDLPSRTHWRVEIRLPADRATFETNVLWYNPTPLEQPYYNWMTAAAFARNDLVMAIPGTTFLEHAGTARQWPTNPAGRFLPAYANNTFAGHKSYHVVGELNDFFGGYYRDDDYGFGHWSRYEEMPGQKLWLWALSREGGVWEDLLTDTDGQYVEYQAGRLLVQYQPGADVNPITQATFEPGVADRWSETWFPLEGIGGLTDASRDGAMHVERDGATVTVSINAFRPVTDTLWISAGGVMVSRPLVLTPLEASRVSMDLPEDRPFRVRLPALDLDYTSDPSVRALARPFATDSSVETEIPAADRRVFAGRELARARQYAEARREYEAVLADAPWHRNALLGLADLEYRRGRAEAGVAHVRRALQLDAYDAAANFAAGNLFRALGRVADARDAFGWAARSVAFRAAAYVQLAELAIATGDVGEVQRYARLTLDYDRHNIPARQILAMIARRAGDGDRAAVVRRELMEIDPLHHFAAAERYLDTGAEGFGTGLRSEYPEQTVLELAIDYNRRGATDDAIALLGFGERRSRNPVLRAWRAWLENDPASLTPATDLALAFPYRRESLPVLEWAAEHGTHWSWSYLLALNLWARDRAEEAAGRFEALGNGPDFAPLYVARAFLLDEVWERDPEPDLRRAVRLAPNARSLHVYLIRHLQDQERWDDALAPSARARSQFPDDFNLDLLHVRTLLRVGRAAEAVNILGDTHVLPSENSRESHRLYEQAHLLVALGAIETGAHDEARRHLRAALEWPEHLGQGRPYDPDDRVVQFLLGRVEQRLGNRSASRAAYEAVVAATDRRQGEVSGPAVLAIAALGALGRADALPPIVNDPDPGVPHLAQMMVGIVRQGGRVGDFAVRAAAEYPEVFTDLDGAILLRALRVEEGR